MTRPKLPGRSPREAALPRWAREELALLRIRLAEARVKIRVLTDRPPSDVAFMQYETFVPIPAYLPEHSTVWFYLDKPGEEPWLQVNVRGEGTRGEGRRDLYVRAFKPPLIVEPVANNVIRCRRLP